MGYACYAGAVTRWLHDFISANGMCVASYAPKRPGVKQLAALQRCLNHTVNHTVTAVTSQIMRQAA
jgi:hypothetical protein